jgi:hypothetical protein
MPSPVSRLTSTAHRKTLRARALAMQDKYQFQWWAVSLVNAVPFGGKKKGRGRRHRRSYLFQAGRTDDREDAGPDVAGDNPS